MASTGEHLSVVSTQGALGGVGDQETGVGKT